MKIRINTVELDFLFRGFAPQYTYEVITGEPFTGGSTRNTHILMYATLMACNKDKALCSLTEFFDWLYEHPDEEDAMVREMLAEQERRSALRQPKKKVVENPSPPDNSMP